MTMIPDPKNRPPTSQKGVRTTADTGAKPAANVDDEWLQLAQSAFYSSTTYMDSNYRKEWDDAIRAFQNQHAGDSKYSQPAYEKRSRLFRPRTRTIIRKSEAAGAAAFFSNMDVVSITPQDSDSKAEAASAEVMKQLLQYRLTKTIPWYQVVLGGLQDAQTVGVACAHIYWEYEEEPVEVDIDIAVEEPVSETEYPEQTQVPIGAMIAGEDGELSEEPNTDESEAIADVSVGVKPPNVKTDKPVIDLFPVDNLRVDPGANWLDPINSSPYLIHLIPMYVLDVKEKMFSGEWITQPDSIISSATESTPSSTRLARQKGRDDPYSTDNNSIDSYSVVWVQRHIHRKDGQDWTFYMLGDIAMLSEPVPLKEVVLHGIRPYVMGYGVLESHKVIPSSIANLGKGLQEEANEIANQRSDNVKFVLNKKFFVKRGKEADIPGLVRNVPGGVVLLDDPATDVKEMTWQDVTGSSFQESQGINAELDELLGNFNPAQLMANGGMNAPARNMALLGQSSGTLVEYLLRTYTETFVQPVLRHLVKLEQAYETDTVIMAIAAKKAKMMQKFGIDQVTDDLLNQELTLTVNVGMGATDPMQKLNKFLTAMQVYTGMLQKPIPGIDMAEVGKEIFGHLGYSDGTRFFSSENPQLQVMQQQMQQMMGVVNELKQKLAEKKEANQVKLITANEKNKADLQKTVLHEREQNRRALATHYAALMNPANQPRMVK